MGESKEAAREPASGAPEPSARDGARAKLDLPRPGDIVGGKYKVIETLGRGGMGIVVAAEHLDLGHQVALKFVAPARACSPDVIARFYREARASVALRSEHVARVLDVGTPEDGLLYLVMELLSGEDLGEVLQERERLPVEEAVLYLLHACVAVAEAHARGIIHRDIKPSNLFLTQRHDGSPLVKVLDFGVAKTPADEGLLGAELTATGGALGTPLYMSPEQVRDAKNVTPQTDVWSLGLVLYELLAGASPFAAASMPGIGAAIVSDPPPPLRERRPDVPEALEAVILRCLEKDPERRFATVTELAAALAQFTSDRVSFAALTASSTGGASQPGDAASRAASRSRSRRRAAQATTVPNASSDTQLSVSSRPLEASTDSSPARARRWRIGAVLGAGALAAAALWALRSPPPALPTNASATTPSQDDAPSTALSTSAPALSPAIEPTVAVTSTAAVTSTTALTTTVPAATTTGAPSTLPKATSAPGRPPLSTKASVSATAPAPGTGLATPPAASPATTPSAAKVDPYRDRQ